MNQQTKTYVIGAIGLAVIASLILWGANRNEQSAKNQKDYSIGVILPLSGSATYYGEQSRKAIELAKDELKQEYPDTSFELLYDDSFYTPKGGIDAYHALQNKTDLDAVITLASHVSVAVQPLANQDRVLQMGISTSANNYTTLGDLSFRVSTRAEGDTGVIADYIVEQNYQRLAGIYLNNDFGLSFWETLKKELDARNANVQILAEEAHTLDTFDFRTILTKIKNQNPDAIFMVGTAAHGAEVMKQAREIGLDAQFLSARSAEDPVLISSAGNLADGLIYAYGFDPASLPAKKFSDRFQERHGAVPDQYAAEAYEGLRVVVLALNECGGDSDCMKQFLQGLSNYDSIFGELNFDENGDVSYNYFLKAVKDGKFIRYE